MSECTCEEIRSKTCPIHGFCRTCGDFIEDGPCSCVVLCFCGKELPGAEQGDFCSQACRSQALEETK